MINSNPQIQWQELDDQVYRPHGKPLALFQHENHCQGASPVYINRSALIQLLQQLEQSNDREQGGILFGHAYEDPQVGTYTEIVAAVAAGHTLSNDKHLQFTAQSWQGIMNYARTVYAQTNIIGWYHSHPNWGVFMSGTDRRTQRAFFYHPWSLSIVYDPIRRQIGYFMGDQSRPVSAIVIHD